MIDDIDEFLENCIFSTKKRLIDLCIESKKYVKFSNQWNEIYNEITGYKELLENLNKLNKRIGV